MEGAAGRIGTLVGGKYRIDAVLGEGGMGVVYRAFDVRLERPVALKLVRAELVASSPTLLDRFEREARAAARLSSHPNIVMVYEDGRTSDGVPFIAQELLSGASLAQILEREGRLSPARARELLVPAMEGVAFAHQLGIVHRDLKPENVFIHTDARGAQVPKVVDFGIARVEGSKGPTQAGQALGTVQYMSPEQLSGKDIGPWCDVWALGVVWFECLTRAFPFEVGPDDPTFALVTKILVDAPRPCLSVRPDLPPALAAVIDRALSRDIAARPRDAGAMLAALNEAFSSASAAPMRATPTPEVRAVAPTAAMPQRAPTPTPPYAAQLPSQASMPAATPPRATLFTPGVIALCVVALLLGPLVGGGVFFASTMLSRGTTDRAEAQPAPIAPAAPPPVAPPVPVPPQALPLVPVTPEPTPTPEVAPAPPTPSGIEPPTQVETTPTVHHASIWTWAPGTERVWTGRWIDGRYRYQYVLRLLRNGSAVEGRFEWTRTDVRGEGGVEWVRGDYDDASRRLLLDGYRVTGQVAPDHYRIDVSDTGALSGSSRTDDGDWSSRIMGRSSD